MKELYIRVRKAISKIPFAKTMYQSSKGVIARMARKNATPATPQITGEYIKRIIKSDYYFSHEGYCVCCEQRVTFTSHDSWLRDSYFCTNCRCKPRERSLMAVVDEHYPDWRTLKIHESSPANRGASVKIKKHAKHYTATQYFPNNKFGSMVQGFRNEDLEKQTFKDNSFDLVITLDVMEHVYNPSKVFKEVARTLKKGGAYVFTVPMINKHEKTQKWAKKGKNGEPNFLHEPEYHGNPVDPKGSPVTMHWGYDIVEFIKKTSGMDARIIAQYDKEKGIMGEYNEVVVAVKG